MAMPTWLRLCEIPVTKMDDLAAFGLRDEALHVPYRILVPSNATTPVLAFKQCHYTYTNP